MNKKPTNLKPSARERKHRWNLDRIRRNSRGDSGRIHQAKAIVPKSGTLVNRHSGVVPDRTTKEWRRKNGEKV